MALGPATDFSPGGQAEGLLLVGHGTRDPVGLKEFEEVCAEVARRAVGLDVEHCFLELADPDIRTAIRRMIERGIRSITVAPLLLFAAGHARKDIPAALREATRGIEGLQIRQSAALEANPRIVELSRRRFEEALRDCGPIDREGTLVLLVTRGSSDVEAIERVREFAKQLEKVVPAAEVRPCFAAVAEPSLETALATAARDPYRRIVVQPHLLFAGEVLQQICRAVETVAAGDAKREWIVTGHLGPSPLVAEAIIELARRAQAMQTAQ
jgi:sirohydrochlorin cobaltochelatase